MSFAIITNFHFPCLAHTKTIVIIRNQILRTAAQGISQMCDFIQAVRKFQELTRILKKNWKKKKKKILAMNILLSKHKSHLQRDFWLELFSHLSEIFLIQKQQACMEELFFRVLELQNFFMSKILAMNIFLSKHKSSQILKAAMRPKVFLWILYSLGIWNLRTG